MSVVLFNLWLTITSTENFTHIMHTCGWRDVYLIILSTRLLSPVFASSTQHHLGKCLHFDILCNLFGCLALKEMVNKKNWHRNGVGTFVFDFIVNVLQSRTITLSDKDTTFKTQIIPATRLSMV